MPQAGGPASDIARIAGWYGKLPTVGDFASRRLEADFVDPWDRWLGDGLQALRDALGEAWVEAFLHSPSWHFILSPGVLPGFDASATIAGVVMPSMDRVGRYFPLTLAGSIGRFPCDARDFESVLAWIDRLENTALEALQSDWGIDDLEHALAALPAPADALATAPHDPLAGARAALTQALAAGSGMVDLAPVAHRSDLASVLASGLGGVDGESAVSRRGGAVPAHAAGVALWLADGATTPQLLVSSGLPEHAFFLHLFGRPTAATHVEQPAAIAAAGFGEETVPLRGPAPQPGAADRPDDLLALFEGAIDAPVTDPLAGAPPREDILALFDVAGDAPAGAMAASEPQDDAAHAGAAAAHDDLIALFDKADAAPAPQDGSAAQANADDILGLFDGAPPHPEPPPGR